MRKTLAKYLSNLATSSVHVASFCDGLEAALAKEGENALNYPALLMEPLSGRYTDNREDNPLNIVRGGFSVLIPAEDNDSDKITAAIDKAFEIGAKFIAKINEDQDSALPDFDPDKVEWEEVGPLLSGAYGVLFTFPITRAANLQVDSSDWK